MHVPDGALPPVEGDFVSVTTQNTGNSKIDMFPSA
jgi:hypothetical protein